MLRVLSSALSSVMRGGKAGLQRRVHGMTHIVGGPPPSAAAHTISRSEATSSLQIHASGPALYKLAPLKNAAAE